MFRWRGSINCFFLQDRGPQILPMPAMWSALGGIHPYFKTLKVCKPHETQRIQDKKSAILGAASKKCKYWPEDDTTHTQGVNKFKIANPLRSRDERSSQSQCKLSVEHPPYIVEKHGYVECHFLGFYLLPTENEQHVMCKLASSEIN